MSQYQDLAGVARRWADAAALLERMGRAPVEVHGWLGAAWAGDAARMFEQWAVEVHRATRIAAGALADAAASARTAHWSMTPPRLDAAVDALGRGVRELSAVRVPGEHPQPPVRSPAPGHLAPHRQRRPVPSTPSRPAGLPIPEPRRPVDQRSAQHPGAAGPGGSRRGEHAEVADHDDTVHGWVAEAVRILHQHGYRADQLDPDHLAAIIEHESAGNPRAVNGWDRNAANGTPSMGLMQTIRPTFDRYHLPGHDDILDPIDNIIAGARYAIARYGSVSRTPGIVSLHSGGAYRGY